MKKLSVLLVSLVILLGACSKDEVEKVEKQTLSGTTWEGENEIASVKVSFYENESTMTLSHLTSPASTSGTYTYDYQHPTVVMYPIDDRNAVLVGTISDKSMKLEKKSGDFLAIIFKK